MRLTYLKPVLKELSQGARIAFAREFRHLTQDNVAEKIGLNSEARRRTITRYETNNRVPTEDRLKELAEILNVNINAIRQYDFRSPIDFIYMLMWIEEIYPNFRIDLPITYYTDSSFVIGGFMKEWEEMRVKRKNRKISYEAYIEWKLNYEVKGDKK